MILTSGELLEFMERTPPEDWPTPRGYGYGKGTAGKRMKSWHTYVVREFLNRMAGGDHEPRLERARNHPDCVAAECGSVDCGAKAPCYVRVATSEEAASDG